MSGLPPSWANKLAELGYYADIDTPAINQHKQRSGERNPSRTTSQLSIPELNIADEEDWSGGVLRALERSSLSDKKAKRSSNIIHSEASRRSSTMNVESSKRTEVGRRPATADTPSRPALSSNDSAGRLTSTSQQRWSPPKLPKTATSASKQRWEPPTVKEKEGSTTKKSIQSMSPSSATATSDHPSTQSSYKVPRSFAAAQDQYLSNVNIRKEIDASHGIKPKAASSSKADVSAHQDGDADVYGGMEEEVLDSPQDVDDEAAENWDMVKSPSGLSIQLSPLQIDNQTFELSESTTSPPVPAPSPRNTTKRVETRKRSRSSLIVLDRSRRQASIASTPGSVVDGDGDEDLTAAYVRDIHAQHNLDDLVENDDNNSDQLEFTMIDDLNDDNTGLGIDVYGNGNADGHESDSSTSTAKVATTSSMVFDLPTNETTPEIAPLSPSNPDAETQLQVYATGRNPDAIYPRAHRMIIATGMSGNVYAYQGKALKIVKRTSESGRLLNLHNELSIVRSVCHESILPITEVYVDREGGALRATLVMPLMARSLTDVIALMDHGLQLSEKQVGRVVHDVLQALECLRVNRICHRDVRSDTIMISPDGTSVLTDFANAVREQEEGCCVGDVISAPFWLAPELIEDGGMYTHKSDVWSLSECSFMGDSR